MDIEFVRGNIIDIDTDAVVLPANKKLKEGSGASRAIFEAAGRKKLTEECEKVRKNDACDIGYALPTNAYDLNCQIIIHAIVPKWKDGKHGEYELLCAAYKSSLEIADKMECNSIAFPLLSSGNNGFDVNLALEIAIETIKEHNAEALQKAIIVIYHKDIEDIIKKMGYTVSILPRKLNRKEKNQSENKQKKRVLLDKGIEFINDPRNRKMIKIVGVQIVKYFSDKIRKKIKTKNYK